MTIGLSDILEDIGENPVNSESPKYTNMVRRAAPFVLKYKAISVASVLSLFQSDRQFLVYLQETSGCFIQNQPVPSQSFNIFLLSGILN